MIAMLREIKTAFTALIVLSALTGVIYPLALTAIAQHLFPERANGSLVVADGVVRGSSLLGQDWRGNAWFHGRPSATLPQPYVPWPSTGSNLGPTNPLLRETVEDRVEAIRASDPSNGTPIPVDLVTASASGMDPDISPASAMWQAARVARARGLALDVVRALILEHIEPRTLGFLGEPRVNVLALNLALHALE